MSFSILMVSCLLVSFVMRIGLEIKKQEEVQVDIVVHFEVELCRGCQRNNQL